MFTKDQEVQQANTMETLQLNYSCQLLHNIDKTEVYTNAQVDERQQQAIQPLRYNMGDDEAGIDHMEKNLQGSDLFDLVYTTQSTCNNCGLTVSTDVMNEPIYTLNFDVYQDINIEGKLLQDMQDTLVGCDPCQTSNCVQVGKNISNMPKYFSILLGDKNNLMDDDIAGQFNLNNEHYTIIGILCYKPSSEHYVSYTLNGQHNDGTIMAGWWFFDGLDDKIINTNISDIKNLQRRMRHQGQYAHLIVYQKS
ncbi:hypothetical protein OXYTRIMIC_767 [Oxytricha trifallax]|uniref:USP domain-containing protein n=1 Tax=Oxytricha trifallax TaxID=1172189 RepID=A0A073IAI3_9SPIT|nr:hypothetical protein OXYTRIMIC_767 [Oxytricha trifallax]